MFEMLGIVAICFGLGMFIGLMYLTFKYIIPGSFLVTKGTFEVLGIWWKALSKGFKQGWNDR